MANPVLPENFRKLADGEKFRFKCHPGVPCFTDCCRQLDLVLTPYDVLRISRRLNLAASDFLARHAIIETEDGFAFPHVFLAMVDDGRASCPFVGPEGCRIYADRPGACRTYPLGRGAFLTPDGQRHEIHVLLSEPHCKGFSESEDQDVAAWNNDQDLLTYNAMNDEIMAILQHRRLKDGFAPGEQEVKAYLLALYRLDEFRARLLAGTLSPSLPLSPEEREALAGDDLALLRFGIAWLEYALFG
ncbi:YkgJ family cysteine cluster protein [Thiovibrio sp. JS02]